ncbi:MAG: zinc ABC transporter substrate-binding protein [Nitrospinota bacterium]
MFIFNKQFLYLFIAIIIACTPNRVYAEPIPVFVSIVPQKFFIERIGGNEVEVEAMVKPGESPATFNPNPKKMSKLANAKLYFSIGVPFEKVWLPRIQALQPDLKFVSLSQGLSEANPGSLHEEDPHIWTDPVLSKKMAKKIEVELSKLKPEKKEFFNNNYQTLARELDALNQEIRKIFAATKNRSFMVFHPAWSYFAEAYGLKQVSIEHEGKEPGPRALQDVINKGKKLGIKVIFVQKQFSLSVAKKVAKMIGATVQEMDPLAENYFENMRKTAKAIAGANH